MEKPDVASLVAHRLLNAAHGAKDPDIGELAVVATSTCALAAGTIYGQKSRIQALERRIGEMQHTMSKMAHEWSRLVANQRPNLNTEELLNELLDLWQAGYDDSTLLNILNKRLRGEK